MGGTFAMVADAKPDALDWGRLTWLSSPQSTGAKQLTVIGGTIFPGKGHNFHFHSTQEEVLLVISGSVEQWLEQEKRILGAGDSVFIPAGVVHASFASGAGEGKVVAILSPCVGDGGLEQVDVSGDAPWNKLR